MLEIVLTPLQALHLMAVNIASVAPLVCIWLHRKASRGDRLADFVGRRLAKAALTMLVIGVILGLMGWKLNWLGDDRPYLDALRQIPAKRLWMALGELVFSLVLSGLYFALWEPMKGKSIGKSALHAIVALASGTNLLYHFPFLLTIISVLPTRPDLAGQSIDSALYHRLLVDPEVLSRTVHVWLASIALTGLYVMAFSLTIAKRDDLRDEAPRAARWGGWLAFVPTTIQLFVGTWVLLKLPEVARKGLMGRDPMATVLFMLSLVGTLALLHLLASAAFGRAERKSVVRAMIVMTVVVVLMTGTVRRVRKLATPPEAPGVVPAESASNPSPAG